METSLIGKALGFGSKECRFEPYVSNIKNDYLRLANTYNIAVKKKSSNIKFYSNKKNLVILIKLYKLGIINSYFIINSYKYVKLYPTYFQRIPYSSNIRSISRGLKSFSISVKGLHFLKKATGNSLILLETQQGILTLTESLAKKVAGRIIFIID